VKEEEMGWILNFLNDADVEVKHKQEQTQQNSVSARSIIHNNNERSGANQQDINAGGKPGA
jgi:hypothetical protein